MLERWFEGLTAPKAMYLDIIVYSKEQLEAEAAETQDSDVPDSDWGIVNILGALSAEELPMPPITQLRNALGKSEGGSGEPVDREAYTKAVAFWERHAAVK